MSEPKGEPTRGVLNGADGVLAWLPEVELVGRIPRLEDELVSLLPAPATESIYLDSLY